MAQKVKEVVLQGMLKIKYATRPQLGRFFVVLFFIFLPFSFTLQVLSGGPLIGIIPYLFLIASAFFVIPRGDGAMHFMFGCRTGVLDALVIFLILWSLIHAMVGLILGTSQVVEAVRIVLIYSVSAWVYFYVVFFSNESDHQDILISTAIASLVIGVHWCVESVSKFVLRRSSTHHLLTAEYVMRQNQIGYEQLNKSVLYNEYRAYGLSDRHTTTGAIVSLGGFSTIGAMSRFNLDLRILVAIFFLIIVTLGMATLAWIGYVILIPFAILMSERFWASGRVLQRYVFFFLATCLFVVMLSFLTGFGNLISTRVIWLFEIQVSYILNFDGSSAAVSWWQIYLAEVSNYIEYLARNPWSAFVGEGYSGYGGARFLRGGDAAVFEFLATYGIPLSIFLFLGMLYAIFRGVYTLIFVALSMREAGFLTFSCVGLAFLLISLGHYNTFFNKSIFVFLFLFLGLVRRYA